MLWVTALAPRRISARLCTSWAACLAEARGERAPWPAVRDAASQLAAWARRDDDQHEPVELIARLEAAASAQGRGLDRVALEVAVDSCEVEVACRAGRVAGSERGIGARLALRSYSAIVGGGGLSPSAAMRQVAAVAMEGEPDVVQEVAASLLADWEGDLTSLRAVSRRLASSPG